MMACLKTLEDLSAYIDVELEPLEELALRRHLDICVSCQQAIRTLTALKETVTRTATVHPLPPTLRAAVQVPPRLSRRPLSTVASLFNSARLLMCFKPRSAPFKRGP